MIEDFDEEKYGEVFIEDVCWVKHLSTNIWRTKCWSSEEN